MEHQDNIFEKFKTAAENQDTKDFPGMEKVWSRVDAKLDTQVFKTQKKTNTSWKKFAVAASVVVGSVFAFQFWNQFTTVKPLENSVVETTKEVIDAVIQNDSTAVVTIQEETIVDKKAIEKILQQQLNSAEAVATVDKPKTDTIKPRAMAASSNQMEAVEEEKSGFIQPRVYDAVAVKKAKEEVDNYRVKEEAKSASMTRKAPPLVVVDGKATDKKVSDIKNSEDLETIVELKEPLYIINGKEYSEKELFGPNPTSPYYPLNKQEIESISIYQDEEAIELYGDKGNKGVVVIKTKNRKPAILKK